MAQAAEVKPRRQSNGEANKLAAEDRPVHDWYRFVLAYPPHLVRDYIRRFDLSSSHQVLDPFCGTGTTIVECKKFGIPSIGVEANPMAHFASQVKVEWTIDPDEFMADSERVAEIAHFMIEKSGVDDEALPLFKTHSSRIAELRTLPEESFKLLLTNSISPLPLHKTLLLIECIQIYGNENFRRHQMLALARAIVFSIGNLHFGPEVGIGPAKKDVAVVASWLACIRTMVDDLQLLGMSNGVPAVVHRADARQIRWLLEPNSIDAVITSPPYPNEKDYTRTTRLESVLLGFIHDKADLRSLKEKLLRSNTRNVYKSDDDDNWVSGHEEIQRIADAIEARRIELGKTSGFERLYSRVTKLYFGGIARHLADLRELLRPGAHLAYVVGDQASYLRVMIRTGHILADLAKSLGYELVGIDLFRTRLATATKDQLREEVVVLRWPGDK